MDHYADDLAALTAHLDLREAVHIGHSTGGGEVAHYWGGTARAGSPRAVLISAVPPLMLKTPGNPGGLPQEVFDGFQEQLAAQPRAVLSGCRLRSVLWIQSSRRQGVAGRDPQLVAPGHDGGRQGALRWHRGVFAN